MPNTRKAIGIACNVVGIIGYGGFAIRAGLRGLPEYAILCGGAAVMLIIVFISSLD